jgi:RimJ/RimL family protein N-acetyltransferase
MLHTSRLLLRPWRDQDIAGMVAMNADPRVMEHFLGTLTPAEIQAMVARSQQHFIHHGFGLWAVEAVGIADFLGFVGLSVPKFESHFTPCVEVGWRLLHEHWGRGYATAAARAALAFGFEDRNLEQIVSFTVPANHRSRRVMERLGMTHSPADDFDHPNVPPNPPLRRHVLYRITRSDWAHRSSGQTPGA